MPTTQEELDEALENAMLNGFDHRGYSADYIVSELMTYSATFENEEESHVRNLVDDWMKRHSRTRRTLHRNSSNFIEG